jgi:TRAP-type C4-dicarboxylate transport system substrate-binding protein
MKPNTDALRRRVLVLLAACPVPLFGVSSRAQARQLVLSSYFLGPTLSEKGVRYFTDEVAKNAAGILELSLETVAPTMPFQMMSKASELAHYYATEFSNVEPVLGLSALPMLTATFDEAETLLRIARPYYGSALARHGQILLATEPWRPAALWSTFPIRSVADLKDIRFAQANYVGDRAGWKRTFIRLGVQDVSLLDAELMLANGYSGNIKFAREFGCFMEIFLAAQLNFITVSRQVFDTLTEAQRQVLLAAGRDAELALWRFTRDLLQRDHREMAAHGVSVVTHPPADVLAALRIAAEPDVQSWARAMGADGTALLADYRRSIGRG